MADRTVVPGMFVWRELATDDAERARAFYGELFGWTWKGESMGPSGTYWLASRGSDMVAGVFQKPPEMAQLPSVWTSYVLVADVDDVADRARAAGGKVLRPPDDIPNIGRFAVLADPWGTVFQPFRDASPGAPPAPGPGTFCWETLVTPDPEGAILFYGSVLGLGAGRTPNGEGSVFLAGDAPVADLQPETRGGPSYWATYVEVEKAEASRDRAAALGGKVIVPRIDVPQVGVVSVVADPSGVAIGLFEPGA